MFLGEYKHSLDAKGRLSIPADMRNECGNIVYITKGNEGCITLDTEQGWSEYCDYLKSLDLTKSDHRQFARTVFSRVKQCEFDKSGRINISPKLRDEAHLTKDCTIVGLFDHIEIWDSGRWEEYDNAGVNNFDEITEKLKD